ncbi:hypothetical protein PQX77_018515 [Marasmius sp. AFHP31]|nr:hypothetical protein PQX77_018515 [Marasmius sp. AFHP31]
MPPGSPLPDDLADLSLLSTPPDTHPPSPPPFPLRARFEPEYDSHGHIVPEPNTGRGFQNHNPRLPWNYGAGAIASENNLDRHDCAISDADSLADVAFTDRLTTDDNIGLDTALNVAFNCALLQEQAMHTTMHDNEPNAAFAKPAVFKGDADDVAGFLPMFRNWATEQKALRIKAGQGVTPEDVGKLDNKKIIQSALSFCEGGKAGRWAANYLKQADASTTNATVEFPFEGKWEVFEKQFKVRFGAANEKVDAIRELEHMKQGSRAVTVYSQDFRDAGAKIGLSDADLMIRFRSGLNPEVKKLLVTMDLAQGDLKDLDNLEDRSCRAERALEAEGFSTRKRTETTTTTINATSAAHATQTNPVGGNGKTREDFMRAMCNRCYGCGATDHTKAQGNHSQEQCHHCKRFRTPAF